LPEQLTMNVLGQLTAILRADHNAPFMLSIHSPDNVIHGPGIHKQP